MQRRKYLQRHKYLQRRKYLKRRKDLQRRKYLQSQKYLQRHKYLQCHKPFQCHKYLKRRNLSRLGQNPKFERKQILTASLSYMEKKLHKMITQKRIHKYLPKKKCIWNSKKRSLLLEVHQKLKK